MEPYTYEDSGVSVHSGFPNPAVDVRPHSRNLSLALDLNSLVIKHPSSTYLFRIHGHQWSDQGIHDGDIAVVDRSLKTKDSSLVIAWQGSTFGLSRAVRVDSEDWGVVSAIIRKLEP